MQASNERESGNGRERDGLVKLSGAINGAFNSEVLLKHSCK